MDWKHLCLSFSGCRLTPLCSTVKSRFDSLKLRCHSHAKDFFCLKNIVAIRWWCTLVFVQKKCLKCLAWAMYSTVQKSQLISIVYIIQQTSMEQLSKIMRLNLLLTNNIQQHRILCRTQAVLIMLDTDHQENLISSPFRWWTQSLETCCNLIFSAICMR